MRNSKKLNIILTIVLFLTGMAHSAAGKIIYVDANATGVNDGTSWYDAYNYLQDALADANSSPKPVEIRVAQGIYRPDEDTLHPDGTGDREATFQLLNGITIKGGYAGFGEADPNARDVDLYATILSGDICKDDVGDIDNATRNNNCYHVVTANTSDIGETTILDGFVIEGGFAKDSVVDIEDERWWTQGGGGMRIVRCSPTVNNCIFQYNRASRCGGAVACASSYPVISNCTFIRNKVKREGGTGGSGAAIYTWKSNYYDALAKLQVKDCNFIDNYSFVVGGAICSQNSKSNIVNCAFIDNDATYGGSIYSESAPEIKVTNCLFNGNAATFGGGLANWYSTMDVTNCTFVRNEASDWGGGVYSLGDGSTFTTLKNCILWDNSDSHSGNGEVRYGFGINPVDISHCCIKDCGGSGPDWIDSLGDDEGGNIDKDPCFAEPGYWDPNGTPEDANDDFWVYGDYHLKSQAGRWDANSASWVKDDITSPCIDAGDPASPIGLEPFPNGGIINMGAYGGTEEASKSYFDKPPCETIVAGDLNGDCKIDYQDLFFLSLNWLSDNRQE